jgi:ectoine hydroxylase
MFPEITSADVAAFEQDGYVLKRGYFDAEEMKLAAATLAADATIAANVVAVSDSGGASTELALWNHPSDDIFGAIARSQRMAGGAQRLLGGEVYHYHSKLTMKRPRAGGAWDWHQDYGYWYNNGCLYPHMLSVGIAIDPATRTNGCLQVIKGSHHLGRIDHGRVGGQTGADRQRVEQVMNVLQREYVEMSPGDTLFFHCNTLHCSDRNESDGPRTLLLCAYNRASNNPVVAHHHPQYTPLRIEPDEQVRVIGARPVASAREFLDPLKDNTAQLRRRSVD